MSTRQFTRAELFAAGMSRHQIDVALREGRLLRARRDRYLETDCPDEVVRAVRVGGRLTCLSLLRLHGVFVQENNKLHVHMAQNSSRMRSPHNRSKRLEAPTVRGVRLHWLPLSEPRGDAATVAFVDALAHAVLCQTPRASVATIDSALHLGLIHTDDLDALFGLLPARYRVLRWLIDGRAESGTETIMRLILQSLGCSVELQVSIDEVGRVDLVVNGWLIVECDSKGFHSSWAQQLEDRRRDLVAASLGLTTLRPAASMIMDQPDLIRRAIEGLIAAR